MDDIFNKFSHINKIRKGQQKVYRHIIQNFGTKKVLNI